MKVNPSLDHDLLLLGINSTFRILRRHGYQGFTVRQGRSKEMEAVIGSNYWNLVSVHDHSRANVSLASQLNHMSMLDKRIQ